MPSRDHEIESPRLTPLGEMRGYRISKGESDIRGWDVVSSDQRRIGRVHELIVDPQTMRVRYLDIEVEPKVLGLKKSSHVLVPIAGAKLDDDDNRVYLNHFSSSDLTTIPPYDHRPIRRDYESSLLHLFGADPDTEPADFYDDERFSERDARGQRRAVHDTDYVTRAEE